MRSQGQVLVRASTGLGSSGSCSLGENFPERIPDSGLEVQGGVADTAAWGKVKDGLEDLPVILLSLPGHDHEDQRDLFGVVFVMSRNIGHPISQSESSSCSASCIL